MKVVISLSKTKKTKSARSVFYSKMMHHLGGDAGDNISRAFSEHDIERFKKYMAQLTSALTAEMQKGTKAEVKNA